MKEQLDIIIKQCQKNDRKAQYQLFDLFLPYISVVIRRYLFDQNAVKDLSQEVFITVFKSLKTSFDPKKGTFKSWIRKIAIHQCIQHNKRNRTFEDIDTVHHENSVDPEVFKNFNQEDVMKLIQLLPEQFREVFNMAVIDVYKHSEIAKALGISEAASRKKLSRGKAWLSKYIRSASSSSSSPLSNPS